MGVKREGDIVNLSFFMPEKHAEVVKEEKLQEGKAQVKLFQTEVTLLKGSSKGSKGSNSKDNKKISKKVQLKQAQKQKNSLV